MELRDVLRSHSARLRRIVDRAEEYRFQVLLSEVVPGEGAPALRTSAFRADAEYFYPASAVKLCAAVSALAALRGGRAGGAASSGCIAASAASAAPPAAPAEASHPATVAAETAQAAAEAVTPVAAPSAAATTAEAASPGAVSREGTPGSQAAQTLTSCPSAQLLDPAVSNGPSSKATGPAGEPLTQATLASPLSLLPLREGEELIDSDPSNLNSATVTIAHCVRKICLVSDNEAFNRLFDLVGHRRLNEHMWALGLCSAALRHRLSVPLSEAQNRLCRPVLVQPLGPGSTPGIRLSRASSEESWEGAFCVPPKRSALCLPPEDPALLPGLCVGRAYVDGAGVLVPQPMDFSRKNRMSLVDLQRLLVLLLRPELLQSPHSGHGLSQASAPPEAPSEGDHLKGPHSTGPELHFPSSDCLSATPLEEGLRSFLLEAMSQLPRDSLSPAYPPADYPDDYCKFFLPGLCRVRPKKALKVFNKIGQAYGFTVDNAYVLDIETGRAFFLSMALYTNKNGILNDDKYEYDLAYSVAADVGEAVARALWGNGGPPLSCAPECSLQIQGESLRLQGESVQLPGESSHVSNLRHCRLRCEVCEVGSEGDGGEQCSFSCRSLQKLSDGKGLEKDTETSSGGKGLEQCIEASSVRGDEPERAREPGVLPSYKYFLAQ